MDKRSSKYLSYILFALMLMSNMGMYASKWRERTSFPSKSFQLNYIMNNVLDSAVVYGLRVKNYKSDLYLKGHLKVHHKNRLVRYIPTMLKLEDGVDDYIYESLSAYHYTAPDIFDRKIKATTATFLNGDNRMFDIVDYMDFNIYTLGIMDGKLLSPINRESVKYYKYKVDSVMLTVEGEMYKINIIPRYPSTQLIEGAIWVSSKDWSVRYMEFSGKYDLIRFNIRLRMGDVGRERYLPYLIDLSLNFEFLKNHLEMVYTGWMKYNSVEFLTNDEIALKIENRGKDRRRNNRQCNLSNLYTLTCDTTQLIVSSKEFNRLRPIPLDADEDSLYRAAYMRRAEPEADTTGIDRKKKNLKFWGQVGEKLVSNYNVDMNNVGHISFSPLISPFLLSYSHSKGISYRQELKYNKLFKNGQLLSVTPKIGYNFTKKELYGMGAVRYVYNPRRNGAFELSAGNGNRIYSSVILDQFQHNPDSMEYLDKMEMDYFKDINVNLSHNIEVVNGLNVWAGISAHWRYTRKTVDIEDVRLSYNSFAPRIRVEWTPYMKYYLRGNRKINVGSVFPTFIVDYEKGIKLWKNCTTYDRFEMSMEQQIKLNNVRSLSYHMGGGFFTDKSETFFVDFVDFSNTNLPQGWNDDIGGSFQLLDWRWYNSALHYFRANFTYESPFILLHPVNRLLSFIQKERIYGGILFMPNLTPYFELGYGLGTHVFDAGVFVGNRNGKFTTVGFKFTFELFNK